MVLSISEIEASLERVKSGEIINLSPFRHPFLIALIQENNWESAFVICISYYMRDECLAAISPRGTLGERICYAPISRDALWYSFFFPPGNFNGCSTTKFR